MDLEILMIVHKRPQYTQLALKQLLDGCDQNMRVWVWQNGSDRATRAVVEELRSHPNLYRVHISEQNKRLREPTNWFWENSSAKYVSKVDDDCLLPTGWGKTLIKAHEANSKLGVIGAWRFLDEDFLPELARKKIVELGGGHQLMRNCWVQGSGYVMKRQCIRDAGAIREDESFSSYCIRLAIGGWINGWHFPFIHEEHMDDPRSEYCEIKTDEQFVHSRPLSAVHDHVSTLFEWQQRVRYMAYLAQAASPDPRQHSGWRKKAKGLTNRLKRLAGVREPWRMNEQNVHFAK